MQGCELSKLQNSGLTRMLAPLSKPVAPGSTRVYLTSAYHRAALQVCVCMCVAVGGGDLTSTYHRAALQVCVCVCVCVVPDHHMVMLYVMLCPSLRGSSTRMASWGTCGSQ